MPKNPVVNAARGRVMSTRELEQFLEEADLSPRQRRQAERALTEAKARASDKLRDQVQRGTAVVKDRFDSTESTIDDALTRAEALLKEVRRGRVDRAAAIKALGELVRVHGQAVDMLGTLRDLEDQTNERAEMDPVEAEQEMAGRFSVLGDKGVLLTEDYLNSNDPASVLFDDDGGGDDVA